MSALVTLSVMQGCSAAWLGIRWGIGHSTGLILIMSAVLLLKEVYSIQDMVDLVEGGADWVVGLVMLMLGFWGYWKAWRLRRLVDHVSRLPSAAKGSDGDGSDAPLTASRHQAIEITSCEVVERSLPPDTTTAHQASERARPRSHASASLLAVCVGIVHGMGAPGGILAVLPTLLMPGVAASCTDLVNPFTGIHPIFPAGCNSAMDLVVAFGATLGYPGITKPETCTKQISEFRGKVQNFLPGSTWQAPAPFTDANHIKDLCAGTCHALGQSAAACLAVL